MNTDKTTTTDSRTVASNSIARNAYHAYISEGIADSDGNFIPMSFEAFKAWKHETLVKVFGEGRFIE